MDELTRIKLPAYHINLKEAHKQVFQLCMCYFTTPLIPQSTEQDVVMSDLIPSGPLLDYVLSCSFDHLTHLEPTDYVILDSMAAVQSEIQKHPLECQYTPHIISSLLEADEFVEWVAEVQDAGTLLHSLFHFRYRGDPMSGEDLAAIRRLLQIGLDLSSEKFLLMVVSAVSSGHFSLLEYLFCINAPIPSGILIAEGTAPFVCDLTRQGVDIKAITARGNAILHQVLGRCSERLRCWVLDCYRCSQSRCKLLMTLG